MEQNTKILLILFVIGTVFAIVLGIVIWKNQKGKIKTTSATVITPAKLVNAKFNIRVKEPAASFPDLNYLGILDGVLVLVTKDKASIWQKDATDTIYITSGLLTKQMLCLNPTAVGNQLAYTTTYNPTDSNRYVIKTFDPKDPSVSSTQLLLTNPSAPTDALFYYDGVPASIAQLPGLANIIYIEYI